MFLLPLAVVWHWWIAPILVASAVLMIAATIVGYCAKVIKSRYPPEDEEGEG